MSEAIGIGFIMFGVFFSVYAMSGGYESGMVDRWVKRLRRRKP